MADESDPFAGLAPKAALPSAPIAANDPFAGLAPKSSNDTAPVATRAPDALSDSAWHTPMYLVQEAARGLVSTAAIPAQVDSLLGWLQTKLGMDKPYEGEDAANLVKSFEKERAAPQFDPFGLTTKARAALGIRPEDFNPSGTMKPEAVARIEQNIGSLTPQGTGEEVLGAAAKGVGSSVPFAVLGPGGALMQLAAGAGGGAAAEVAHKVMPDSYWAPVIAGLVGGIAAGGSERIVSNWASLKTAKAAVADTTEALASATAKAKAAADTANETRLPTFDLKADLAKRTAAKVAAHEAAKDTAVAASKAVKDDLVAAAETAKAKSEQELHMSLTGIDAKEQASEAARDAMKASAAAKAPLAEQDIRDGLTSIAKAHGTSVDLDSAGDLVQPVARNFLTSSLPKAEEAAWTPVDAGVGRDTPVGMENFANFVERAKGAGGNLREVIDKFAPNIGAKLDKVMEQFKGEAGEAGAVSDAVLDPSLPTWAGMRQLRSAIGEGLSNPMILRDVGRKNLEGAYATVTADLQAAADKAGFGDAFTNANTTSRELRGFADGPIAEIINGPKPTPGKEALPGEATAHLLSQAKTSGENLRLLRSMPDTATIVDELASVVLRQAFDDPKAWTGLAPRAQAALVPDAGKRAMVETLLADKGRVPGEIKAVVEAADSAHKATLEQLNSERDLAKAVHKNNVRSAGASIQAANAAHAADKAMIAASTKIAVAAANAKRANVLGATNRSVLETDVNLKRLTSAQSAAKEALDAAKAKLAEFKTPVRTHGLNALIGLDLGEHAGDIAGHALGLSGIPYHLSGLVGAIAPSVFSAGHRLVTNPRNALNALIGGEAGTGQTPNPLTSGAPSR